LDTPSYATVEVYTCLLGSISKIVPLQQRKGIMYATIEVITLTCQYMEYSFTMEKKNNLCCSNSCLFTFKYIKEFIYSDEK